MPRLNDDANNRCGCLTKMGEHDMDNLDTRLDSLMLKIKQAGPVTRFKLQPQLSSLIHEIEAQGTRVRRHTRLLNEELLNEAIEAQFENMPV